MKARLAALALAALASSSGAQEARDPGPSAILERIGFDQRPGARLPLEARFRDQDGRALALGELLDAEAGRPALLVLAYYECPMLCTLVLNGLVSALRALELDAGRDFRVIVLSIDPEETPALAAEKRARYLAEYGREGAAEGWSFLVGEEPDIRAVADAIGFRYAYVPERDEWAHASGLVVVTPDGRAARWLFGVEFPPRDLRFALVEASEGRIGDVVDQALLLCFHYDPLTGRYGLAIMSVIRGLGLLTVAALVAFVLRSLARDRRAARPAHAEGRP
jgi:protein SCO1/2